MARRTVPDRREARRERFRHLIVERYASDPALALAHGASRNRHVAQVLCFIALLRDPARRIRPMLPLPDVTCTAAERQFFSASEGDQAAHLLPGQIRIDGVLPWLYLGGEAARQLENLFASVEPLHADFNKADSAAEANGLTDAFAMACRHVLVGTGETENEIVHAYERIWTPGALGAFTAAELQKRTKPAPPPVIYGEPGSADYGNILNLTEREEAFGDESIWATYQQLSVLGYYKASMDNPPPELETGAMRAILAISSA
jgi:hypothetical protein